LIELETRATSCHLKTADPEAVIRALEEATGCGPALPVWPSRPLPPGILVSPVRYGWVSLWGLDESVRPQMPSLTATLECAGVVFHLLEDDAWLMEVYADGRLVARFSSPEEVVQELTAYELAWDELSAEGDPSEEQLRERAGEILAERELPEGPAAPLPEALPALEPLLPPRATLPEALRLLRAGPGAEDQEEGAADGFIEDALENFANYLGIRDGAWDPRDDREPLTTGDYEDPEGLPQGWEEFVLLPATRWELTLE
jgi:hypothetical protein